MFDVADALHAVLVMLVLLLHCLKSCSAMLCSDTWCYVMLYYVVMFVMPYYFLFYYIII